MNWKSNLTVAVITMAHVLEVRQIENRQELSGGEGMLLKAILEALGFEYKLVVPADKEFGRLDENGEWTGLIGMVQRREVDLACNAIIVTSERSEAVEFSTTYGTHSRTFAIEKSRPARSRMAYLYTFPLTVWTCFVGVLMAVSVQMWIFFNGKYSFGRVIMDLSGLILRQPMTFIDKVTRHSLSKLSGHKSRKPLDRNNGHMLRKPSELSGSLGKHNAPTFRQSLMLSDKTFKIYLSLWSLYSLVISSCYTCALLSAMTFPVHSKTVETFKELSEAVKKGTHRCFTMKGSYTLPFLLSTRDQHLQELGRTIEKKGWLFTASSMGEEDVIDLNTAQIGSRFDLELYYGSESNIFISRYYLSVESAGIAISPSFCCKEKLNEIVSSFISAGLVDKIYGDAAFRYRLQAHKTFQNRRNRQSLSVEDISGIIILLALGHSLAFLVFLGEVVWK